eukprot:m.312509 g.312509  ORF g.312509 m.312509 type:complete len:95 (+) comp274350_c0_seq1:172-456(+)
MDLRKTISETVSIQLTILDLNVLLCFIIEDPLTLVMGPKTTRISYVKHVITENMSPAAKSCRFAVCFVARIEHSQIAGLRKDVVVARYQHSSGH